MAIPLEFHGRVDAVKRLKEAKVARTVAGENDDLVPMVEGYREDGTLIGTICAPQVDRDMGALGGLGHGRHP